MSALRFNAAADKLLRTASILNIVNPYTVMFWAYMSSALASDVFSTLWISGNNLPFGNGAAQIEGFDFTQLGANVRLESYTTASGSYDANGRGATNLVASTWYCCAMRRNSATSLTMHLITVAGVLTQESNITDNVGTRSHTRGEFGSAWSTNNDPFDGRMTAFKAWSAALSNEELLSESRRYRPIRLDSLHMFTPLFGAATDVVDLSGNARDWTIGGTLTVEKGPPIPW